MMIGARCGSFALILGVLVMPGPLMAQTETPGGWTDPPVRGAASPKTPEAAKPDDSASAPEKAAPEAAKPVESAAAPEKAAPARAARTKAVAQTQPARRSAKLRREQIRRVAARSRTIDETPQRTRPHPIVAGRLSHHAVAEHARPRAERRTYAYRAYRSPSPRYGRYAWGDEASGYRADVSPYRWRRAGWGGLVGDDPASRIAQARAAGYLVMRSRTYEYPDGTRVRSLMPYEPDGLE